MDKTIQLTISSVSQAEQEILIALLSSQGFEGFEQQADSLIACIRQSEFDGNKIEQLIKPPASIQIEVLEPRNWNEVWEQSFEPVLIGNFCGIRAQFHKPLNEVQHEIVITPKMSFGTGHHATTYQVIDMMSSLDLEGKSVLDFGTGTGVLAILASKLGAANVIAIDNDEWSVENASENILFNAGNHIDLQRADTVPSQLKFDVILANLNKQVILMHLASVAAALDKKGVVIFSGLLIGDREEVIKAALKNGMTLVTESMKDNWIALKMSI